jgi:hypothetical protein
MGEAKRKSEALRQSMLKEMDLWTEPPSDYERQLAAEISGMPVVKVLRPPRAEIIQHGMKPQECHQNCISYCQLDPEGRSTIVTGWWIKGDNYVSHSVVRREQQLFCVTPYIWEERQFRFVPDSKITWSDGPNGTVVSERDGRPLELRVRMDPERTIQQCNDIRALVVKGIDPMKAWERVTGMSLG